MMMWLLIKTLWSSIHCRRPISTVEYHSSWSSISTVEYHSSWSLWSFSYECVSSLAYNIYAYWNTYTICYVYICTNVGYILFSFWSTDLTFYLLLNSMPNAVSTLLRFGEKIGRNVVPLTCLVTLQNLLFKQKGCLLH